MSFCSLYFLISGAGAWMAPVLLTPMFCAYDKTQSLRDVVTRTGKSLFFLPVTYKSHLCRELHMPWACHELLKDLGIWALPVSCTATVPYAKSFCEKSDRQTFSWKTGHGNNCSNCISNRKIMHIVHPVTHSFWCLWFTRRFP